ncbi:MAG: DUF4244 domain-containing protein [Acidimicrobiia bacterium]|jgi:hypothetical protein
MNLFPCDAECELSCIQDPVLADDNADTEAGQATAEYALIIAAAAAIAALLLTWAARTDAIGRLFNAVLDHVISSF